MENQTSKFEGWAVVEMFGHSREVGYGSLPETCQSGISR